MAAKWQDVKGGGGNYNLQYRTAGDNRVREEHAALNGTTLPANDPFWRSYYPPNGWMCRCNVVEVRKEKFPESDSKEAIRRGDAATDKRDRFGNNKGAIFRFNPGAQERIFPEKHPYFPKGCGDCEYKSNLAYRRERQECQVCENLYKADIAATMLRIKEAKDGERYNLIKDLTQHRSFKPMKGEKGIYSVLTENNYEKGTELRKEFDNQKEAAIKAAKCKYEVYILPNPKQNKTPDFIFKRNHKKGNKKTPFYAMYELKTIEGQNSADNRLIASTGQAHRVVLNMKTDYNPRKLAKAIKAHFDNKSAQEVLVLKGGKDISVTRDRVVDNKRFINWFIREYNR